MLAGCAVAGHGSERGRSRWTNVVAVLRSWRPPIRGSRLLLNRLTHARSGRVRLQRVPGTGQASDHLVTSDEERVAFLLEPQTAGLTLGAPVARVGQLNIDDTILDCCRVLDSNRRNGLPEA